MNKTCTSCKAEVEIWNKKCGGCGYTLVLQPDEARRAQYLKTPSLGALLWTQGWTFGARLYLLFLLSLVPLAGFVVLFVCLIYGRRLSWKYGGWEDWSSFQERMRLLDAISLLWIIGVMVGYFYLRSIAMS